MNEGLSKTDAGKFAAAQQAVGLVEDGMRLGLGSGSTANWMVRALAARVRDDGLRVDCAATSSKTATLARNVGLQVRSLNDIGWLDLTIDGADEFDPSLNLIKGGGGAHLQEKVVAAASERMIVITDPSKEVARLGAFPLPVEVLEFGLESSRAQIAVALENLGFHNVPVTLRGSDTPFLTDEGNRVLDLHLDKILDARALSDSLLRIPGVVETGLFLGLCDGVVIGHPDGRTEQLHSDGTRIQGQVDLDRAANLPAPA